jgi:hypothetical protein
MGWKKMKSVFLRYHGTFLASLIDNSPKPLEISRELPGDNHLYVINREIGVYVTYSTKRMSPWNHTFQPKHLTSVKEQFDRYDECFLILVCGFETTAVLNKAEVNILLPLANPTNSSISIKTGHDRKLQVSGSAGKLKSKLSKTRTYERLIEVLK